MNFLRFIFSSFWVWLGFIILLSMIGEGVIELVKACKRGREIQVAEYPGSACRKIVTIKRANEEDVKKAIEGTEKIYPPVNEERKGGGNGEQ